MTEIPVAVVTGASGYLGSRICSTLQTAGWQVVRVVRSPGNANDPACAYDLGAPVSRDLQLTLRTADVLVHAAYDLGLTRAADIWRVNVEGTRRLLEAAHEACVRRILVLSSMSAFEGTTQLYGRAKLEIEAAAERYGGCAVRPGLVYGYQSGGMARALSKLTALPLVPLIAGDPQIYAVREDDLMIAIGTMAAADVLEPAVISLAHPVPVPLRNMMTTFAAQEGRRPRFIKIPWKPVYGLLRAGESVGLHLPFRADSLLGLVRSAPSLVNPEVLTRLNLSMRGFESASANEVIGCE